jgi:hypothetical protein
LLLDEGEAVGVGEGTARQSEKEGSKEGRGHAALGVKKEHQLWQKRDSNQCVRRERRKKENKGMSGRWRNGEEGRGSVA